MALPEVPNWLLVSVPSPIIYSLLTWRSVLLILTLFPFLPQLYRIFSRKDSSGISAYYVFFNLISATEQFTIAFFLNMNTHKRCDFFVHDPATAGDWINLAQLGLVWILWLML